MSPPGTNRSSPRSDSTTASSPDRYMTTSTPSASFRSFATRGASRLDRGDLRVWAAPVRVRVVVGQRREHEVVEVVLLEERAHAGGVLVALARHAEDPAAVGPARGEQVRIEELVRPPHGMREA